MSPLVTSSASTPAASSVNLTPLRSGRVQSAVGTVTTTTTSSDEESQERIPDGTLRLRGGPVQDRRVTWGEDVIDNEGLGRKKSKVCCIFHRAREFGESSDESSSDDDDSSSGESDNDDGRARRVGAGRKGCGEGHHDHNKHKRKGRKSTRRQRSPNAYERMPRQPKKKE